MSYYDTCHCDCCDLRETCELVDGINFCEDCKDCDSCTIKLATCEAGYEIECNNGFEIKDTCCFDEEDEEYYEENNDDIAFQYITGGYF